MTEPKERDKLHISQDIPMLIECLKGYNSAINKSNIAPCTKYESAMYLFNLSITSEENRVKIGSMGGVGYFLALAGAKEGKDKESDDLRIASIGALAYLAKSPELHSDMLKGVSVYKELLKTDKERLRDATCLCVMHLAMYPNLHQALQPLVKLLVHGMTWTMEYTQNLKQNVICALHLLASRPENAQLMLAEGILPHLVEALTRKSKIQTSTSLRCLELLLEVGEFPFAQQMCEEQALPKMVALIHHERATDEGHCACLRTLLKLAKYPTGDSIMARAVEEGLTQNMLKLYGDYKAEEPPVKAKKKKGKLPPLSECQLNLQQAMAGLLAGIASSEANRELAIDAGARPVLESLQNSVDEQTRAFARQALWNLKCFEVPDDIVHHFKLGDDIVCSDRDRPLSKNDQPFRTLQSSQANKSTASVNLTPRSAADPVTWATDNKGNVLPMPLTERSTLDIGHFITDQAPASGKGHFVPSAGGGNLEP
ncbi:hypothetical protein CYMTET_26396 [Cymbomonas tetramitiformis]|uniref:Uncharacterized protein n=1 Tax=Cymbomonas tetramitiformis TaxID=36881 RepID=A0AAE0KY98_9CHLO|nr:hypothetical protein CYMTET_26396 [Cymbomonas tetramitiformis]